MHRWLLAPFLLAAGCATVVPLETASALPPGGYRVGVQLSGAAACGTSGNDGAGCSVAEPGTPLPELRVSGRRGVYDGFDLGASFHATASLASGSASLQQISAGVLVDGKLELWQRPLGEGRRQLLSLGAGIGFGSAQPAVFSNAVLSNALVDLVVPLFYGFQTENWELVASPRFDEQLAFDYTGGDSSAPRRTVATPVVGLALSAFTRSRRPWAFGVEARGPAASLSTGVVTLGAGKFWDFGP